MKLPFTDKFLWDMYKVLEGVGDVADFVLSDKYKKSRILLGDQNPVFAKYRRERGAKKFAKLIYYLKQKNYIKITSLEEKQGIILTKEGISKALRASFVLEGGKKRRDGRWVMITFDIPQKHKKARMLLRSIMINLGYKMFQQSIWVCPFDVSEKTEQLLQMHDLEKYVKIFLIEELEK